MQVLIEELQSQLLSPSETRKDNYIIEEGNNTLEYSDLNRCTSFTDKSTTSVTTPYCTPSRSRESCTHITNCSIVSNCCRQTIE